MKAKIFLIALFVLAFIFALSIVASAEEYTIFDNDGFKSAFDSAVDGDTIVINGNIEAELDFGKSVTYIINGDYTWTAGGRVSAPDKTINIYARGGNAVFKPNASLWINSYEPDILAKLNGTIWSLGTLEEDSTLSFDLTIANQRLMYGLSFKEINFGSGTIVENCNNIVVNDTRYFIAATINIYDGAIFRGIRVCPYRGFFECTTLNIYGGEIYGCYFMEYGMCVNVKSVNMYGGKIHDVYLNFSNTGVTEGLFNNSPLNMYGGEIYNNYIKISSAGAHSILAGSKHLVGGSVYDNYTFTSWETNPALNENGLFEIENLDLSTGADAGYGKNGTTVYDYSVVFKNTDGSVISAYLVKSGAIKSTISDATEVTVPSGYSFTTTRGTCAAVEPDVTKQGTYYVVKHTFQEDDFDCTTSMACQNCSHTVPALSHVLVEVVSFANGYDKEGVYLSYCKNEGCSACDEERVLGAVIISLGYSFSEKETGFYSVSQGFSLNCEIIDLINRTCDKKISDFGIFVAVKDSLGGATEIFENGELTVNKGAIAHSLASSMHDYIDVKITGLEGENENGIFANMEFVIGAYITFEDEEEINTLYVDAQGITKELSHWVTYESFIKD